MEMTKHGSSLVRTSAVVVSHLPREFFASDGHRPAGKAARFRRAAQQVPWHSVDATVEDFADLLLVLGRRP